MQQSDRAGLLYVLSGFCILSVCDAIVKGIDGAWTPIALSAFRFALGACVLAALLFRREGLAPLRTIPKPGLQILRGVALSIATVAFFSSLWLMPFTDAVAIAFTQPILTAILAAIFLGERLRVSTLLSTIVAFGGVLTILRPNFADIGFAALLPLIAALGIAVVMTANRAARGSGSALAMQVYVATPAAIILIIASGIGHWSGFPEVAVFWPEWHVLARLVLVTACATSAHWLIYKGTERAGAATVAPMMYGQLLVATAIGWFIFNEAPDAVALMGAALIIAAGLWLWHEGRSRPSA